MLRRLRIEFKKPLKRNSYSKSLIVKGEGTIYSLLMRSFKAVCVSVYVFDVKRGWGSTDFDMPCGNVVDVC